MNCPMCVAEVLAPQHRNGVEIDVCPRCRGVWLDRGELERLAVPPQAPGAGARRFEGEPPAPQRIDRSEDDRRDHKRNDRDRRRDDDDDDDDDDDREWRPKGKHRGKRDDDWQRRRRNAKKSFGERLADVFDDILD